MLKPEAWPFSGPKIAPSKPPALHVSRYVLSGTRWVRALLYGGTQIGLGGTRWVPSSSLRGTQIGFGGMRWDPVGPSPSLRGTLHPVWVLQC